MTKLGAQIKEKRERKKITQDELAEACGLSSKRVIWDYESGRTNPSLQTLEKIAKELGCEVEIKLKNKTSKAGSKV